MPTPSVSIRNSKKTVTSFRVYLWIISYLKKYKFLMLQFILCGLLISFSELVIPKIIQYLIDHVFPQRDYMGFTQILFVVLAVFCVTIAVATYRNKLQRFIQEMPSLDILQSLFEHLRKLGFAYYERHPTGETMSMFREELENIQSIYRKYLPGIVQEGTMFVISASLLVITNSLMSIIVLPCFLSYYLFGPYFEKKAALWALEVQKRRTVVNKKLFDSISGLLELRAFHAVKWDLQNLKTKHAELNRANTYENWYAYLRGTVRRVTSGLGALFIFAIGIEFIQNGKMTIGEFVAFTILYFYVINNLTRIVTLTTEQRIIVVQAEKLYQFMALQPAVNESEKTVKLEHIKGKITFKDVSFSYAQFGAQTLQNVNFQIYPGEKIALVGKSGHGKTTIIKLFGRFYDPNGGQIFLDDIELDRLSLSQLREAVGYVFQETYMFDSTIRENIRFGNPQMDDHEVIRAAKAAYAHDFITELPSGYDTVIGERGVKLSGGERQRLAIARMFIKNPRIVILDEATSALDNISEHEVKEALDKLMEGRTTIAIAHRLSTVQDYDRILVVEKGCIQEKGTYSDLVSRRGIFYKLLKGQSEVEASNEK